MVYLKMNFSVNKVETRWTVNVVIRTSDVYVFCVGSPESTTISFLSLCRHIADSWQLVEAVEQPKLEASALSS